MNAVEMKFGRVPHGLEILRQAAGFENRTGPGGFVKAPIDRYVIFGIVSLLKTLPENNVNQLMYFDIHRLESKSTRNACPRVAWDQTRTLKIPGNIVVIN